jgi:hypothetical protein
MKLVPIRDAEALDPKARMLRLIAEFYDFTGATGHIRNDASILVITCVRYGLFPDRRIN